MKKCPKCDAALPDYADTCSKCNIDINSKDSVLPIDDRSFVSKMDKPKIFSGRFFLSAIYCGICDSCIG